MTVDDLPAGSAKAALTPEYFPVPYQAVIFRNWNKVPAARIAAVLQAPESAVRAAASALGLPEENAENISLWLKRGYLTIIRENWHLLDYAQLLSLLDWTPEKLDFTLREEDFLYHKLGDRKPQVRPPHYRELTPAEAEETAAIRALIAPHAGGTGEAPFAFFRNFGNSPQLGCTSEKHLRLIYSYCAPYGDLFADPVCDPFPEGLLTDYERSGVNAVWLQAVLYTLVPWTGDEDLSSGHAARIAGLKAMISRLARHGIKLYLYLNEPRALPPRYMERHPGWGGTTTKDGTLQAFCFHNPEVAARLRAGIAELCRELPDLGGFFSITYSENLTHCHSRGEAGNNCPYCKNTPPEASVIAALNAIYGGIRDSGSRAELLAWNWSWSTEWDLKVLAAIPREIALLTVSETGVVTECEGRQGKVIDYSISHPGPGPVAPRLWEFAKKQGRRIVAKVQLNATWELSNLPYIPVPFLVQKHLDNLRACGIDDFVLSWTLGGAPGGNLGLLDNRLEAMNEKLFGPEYAPEITNAEETLSRAFALFPFDQTYLIYLGPQNFGPANPLYRKPTGYHSTMVGFPYDDFAAWGGWGYSFPPEAIERDFYRMCDLWQQGLEALTSLRSRFTGAARVNFEELWNMAEAAYCILRSSALQMTFYHRRDDGKPLADSEVLLRKEMELALRLLACQKRDSRIGFEASNHYMYDENILLEKLINCRFLLNQIKKENLQ